jgi:biopolymer transport protein ExbD
MGMNVGTSSADDDGEVMVDINTTPLIDVMLVLLIMFDGTLGWNGEVIAPGDRAAVQAKLAAAAALSDQPELHIRPNKLAAYEHVAMVLAGAQRLGMTKIGIVGNEQFQ